MSAEYALVGRIRKAHGIRGEVVVEATSSEPEATFAPGSRLFVGDAAGDLLALRAAPGAPPALRRAAAGEPPFACTVTHVRPHQGALLLTLDAIADRTAAEQWRGRTLLVPVEELTEPDEGEVFLHELAGMAAVDEGGAPLGTVRDWYEVPQGILLSLERDGRELLVPFVDAMVREVDREARRLVLRLPEGLGT
jgi:16S rRNA processing protein RimM